ncbi:monocarboxylate transporter 13-like [Gigantopelta aegis]|uniref:monocarboxylate transporter 13-like n=1 Tax=Gigantopelta aegis TaxID=1735272 RepID=UPI001B88A2ED|nr:monocarboxylate transporter 13-like [Gigantopelta aegis]
MAGRSARTDTCLIVLSCSLVNLVVMGFGQGLALVYVHIVDVFQTTRATASLLQSLCFGITFLGSCIGGPLAGKLGPGITTMLGSVTAAVGVVVASFSTDVIMLVISGGVVAGNDVHYDDGDNGDDGLGLSMIYPSQFITVGHVCERRKTIALSAMSVASGLGGFVFAFLNFYLLDEFGWRGTLFVSGAIILNCFVGGMAVFSLTNKKQNLSCTKPERSSGFCISVFQPKLFTDLKFVLFLFCGLLNFTTLPTLTFFIVDHALHLGLDIKTGTFLLSAMSIGNVCGRLIGGFVNSVLKVTSLIVYAVSSFLAGVTMVTLVYVTGRTAVLLCVVVNGLLFGVAIVTVPVATLEIAGLRRYPAGIGYYFGVIGLGHTLCGPFGGGVKDYFGSYDIMYYCAAGCGTLSAILMTCLELYSRTREDMTHKVPAHVQETDRVTHM